MSFEICMIGRELEGSRWESVLEGLGSLTKFDSIEDTLMSNDKIHFNLTFITASAFKENSSNEVFALRKESHSRIIILGHLDGFAPNFLSEAAIFDWCSLELLEEEITTRMRWYKDRILSLVGNGSVDFIRENKIQLTRKEELILNCLYAQKVVHVDDLQKFIWKDIKVTLHVLDVHLCNLRKKIKPFQKTIKKERNGNIYLRECVA